MAKRRANGEGSVHPRQDGRWAASLSLGNGTRKHFTGRTAAEARSKMLAFLKAQQEGLPVLDERQTVRQFLTHWLETTSRSRKPRTQIRYEELVRLHVLPEIGSVRLARLTPQELQSAYSKALGRGLSSTTVHQVHAVMHRALKQAASWGAVARNVADLVEPPPIDRKEMQVLTGSQAQRLLQAAAGDRFEALYVLAVTTGMRQGELLALRWREVDLERHTLQVRATLHRVNKEYVFTEPKSASSRRQILLTELACQALRRHKAAQAEERLRLGAAWPDTGLVFTNPAGGPVYGSGLLRHSFYPLLGRAALPRVRFHDLRHTAATLLLEQAVHPKVVAEMLGHSTIAITLNLYSHVTPTMQREAARAMDLALGNS